MASYEGMDGYLQKIQHFSQGYNHRQKIERGTLPLKGTLHIMDQKKVSMWYKYVTTYIQL